MAITAVVGAGLIGAAGSVISGGEQAGAANKATQAQMSMYNQTRADLAPYNQGGQAAFSQLQSLLGLGGSGNSAAMQSMLQNFPGYQFALQQGQQGLDRTAASKGLLLSGGQLKDTVNYNQGMADQLFQSYAGDLSGVAGLGENAAAQTGNAATQTGAGIANTTLAAGQANASGIAGASNNLGGILMNPGVQSLLTSGGNGSAYSGISSLPQENVGLTGYGALDMTPPAVSDRRLKENIEQVGTLDSGLPVYKYNFRGSRIPQMGVMAQDVEKVAPHAVVTRPDGIKTVRYDLVSKLPAMKRAA